jgi:hypothetical protein
MIEITARNIAHFAALIRQKTESTNVSGINDNRGRRLTPLGRIVGADGSSIMAIV